MRRASFCCSIAVLLWGSAILVAQSDPPPQAGNQPPGAGARPPSRDANQPPRAMERAVLGVAIQPRSEAGGHGVSVAEVMPNGPAAKAGVMQGDVITKIENQDIADYESLTRTLSQHKPGDKVKLSVKKGDQTKEVTVTLGTEPRRPFEGEGAQGRRPMPGGAPGGVPGGFPGAPGGGTPQRPPMLGVQMQPLTPELQQRLGVEKDQGVVVAEVLPGSPAEHAGLKRDDVIVTAEGKAVNNPEDLQGAVRQVGMGHDMNLTILRAKEKKEVKVRLEPVRFEGMPQRMEGMMAPGMEMRQMMQRMEQKIDQLEKRIADLEKRPK
jgi:C-terminal processing protease CtpA/Prc